MSGQAAALGRLQLSYGVGMIAGSLLGGTLSAYVGYSNVALIGSAAAGATPSLGGWVGIPCGSNTAPLRARAHARQSSARAQT